MPDPDPAQSPAPPPAEKDSAPTKVKVRVLVAQQIEGTDYVADDVAEIAPAHAAELTAQFQVDSDPAAVAYAESLKA